MTIGERIREKRIAMNLSQEELAFKLGYSSRSSVTKIESGQELPSKLIHKIAVALDTTESYIMGWDSEIEASEHEQKVLEAYRKLDMNKKQAVDSFIVCIGDDNLVLESKIENNSLEYERYKAYIEAFEKMSDEKKETIKNLFNVLKE